MRNRNPQQDLRRSFRAFTLIEVLIVVAILLALGGLVVVNLLPAKDQADVDLQKVQFDQIDAALKKFKLDMKRWPSEDEGLTVLVSKTVIQDENDSVNWRGPYLESSASKDKWNHAVVYRVPSEALGEGYYDLLSWGPDGQEGTKDDITNHDRLKNAQGEIEIAPGMTPGAAGANADSSAPPPATGG